MITKNINICEGTTHYLNIDCFKDETKDEYDLTNFQAILFMNDSGSNVVTKKESNITNNNILIKIEPEDTLHKKEINYECRVFSPNGDVFHIMCGKIIVTKSGVPIDNMMEQYPNFEVN